jgi:hypothetical protein
MSGTNKVEVFGFGPPQGEDGGNFDQYHLVTYKDGSQSVVIKRMVPVAHLSGKPAPAPGRREETQSVDQFLRSNVSDKAKQALKEKL